MRVVALDLDKKTAFVTVQENGTQLEQRRIGLDPASLAAFRSSLQPDDILCMEACPGSYYLCDFLQPAVSKVVLVNPIGFGRLLALSKQKMDRNDSGLMARLFDAGVLPQVWVPDQQTRDERLYAEHRMRLDQERTRHRNRVHALLTEYGLGYQAAELVKMDVHLLLARVKGALPELAYDVLASTLRMLETVEYELRLATARIVARGGDREAVELARSIPGVDDLLSSIMTNAVGDVSRFATPGSVPNYAGVTPSLNSSGPGKPKHGRITKKGSRLLRWAAIEAAKNARLVEGRFRQRYQKLRRRGKSHAQAMVAIAREILEVLWHVLTKKEKYRDVPAAFKDRKERRRKKKLADAHKILQRRPDSRQSILSGLETIRRSLEATAAVA